MVSKVFFEAQNKRFETQFDFYLENERPKNVQVVWLFDGLDELPKAMRKDWLERIKKKNSDCCIVTCRTALYDSDYRRAFGESHYVMGLYTKDQIDFLNSLAKEWREGELSEREFVKADEAWVNELHSRLQTKDNIRRLAGSPLLLTLIARTNAPGKIDLPAKRVDFYKKAFKQLVKQREEQESANTHPLQTVLANLAFEISQNEIVAEFDENIFDKYCATFTPQETLALKKSGILRFSDDQRCQWLHQTFQEWLLAEYLHVNGGLLKAVERYWKYTDYQEVLMMLWGLSSEQAQRDAANFLIEQGCQPHPRDPNKRCSGLRIVLTLVNGSGIELKNELFDVLWKIVRSSKGRKEAVAILTTTPQAILLQLANDDDWSVRDSIAGNPNTPTETLAQLAKDGDCSSSVAGNPSTPAEILAQLAKGDNWLVRYSIAGNPNTSAETLAQLANDDHFIVRISAEENAEPSVQLANDDHFLVRIGAEGNPDTPAEILAQLGKHDDVDVRSRVAGNPSTPAEILAQLAKDYNLFVWMKVAQNPNSCLEWF